MLEEVRIWRTTRTHEQLLAAPGQPVHPAQGREEGSGRPLAFDRDSNLARGSQDFTGGGSCTLTSADGSVTVDLSVG
ncbi:hypothetical protein [Streptomyces sp. FH025]|uniref:hypothetical protein n=1 Tax=Streptomyces sp. FH025 TaxID=2815937 RepID=UPI001A9CC7F2|nr:hypothetical protein [Streptomyces sp. FH025]MBO1415677.1 hypothetical protein [Streptomyces sp. FH025]